MKPQGSCTICFIPISKSKSCCENCTPNKPLKNRVRGVIPCEHCLTPTKNQKYCCVDCSAKDRRKKAAESGKAGNRCARLWLIQLRGHKCEICNNTEWLGSPITLELDHIDGNPDNGKLENLRIVCPNCHSKTPTWKARNTGNGRHKRMERYRENKSY